MSLIELVFLLGTGVVSLVVGIATYAQAGPLWALLGAVVLWALQLWFLYSGLKWLVSWLPRFPQCECRQRLREVNSTEGPVKLLLLSCDGCERRYVATVGVFGSPVRVFRLNDRVLPYRRVSALWWVRDREAVDLPDIPPEWVE